MSSPTNRTSLQPGELLAVGAVAGLVALFYMAPLLSQISYGLPIHPSDPQFNAWLLAWGADRLPHGLQGYWSPPVFYPYQNSLAYSENLLGIAIFVAPVYWLSSNPILTYNVAFLFTYVVAAVGAYALARELTGRRDAAAIAACAFAFTPYRWAQLVHLPVLAVGWLPLALWALHRAFRAPSWRILVALVVSLLLLAFSSSYAAYQSAFIIPLVIVWCMAAYGVTREQLWRFAAAGLVFGLLLAPVLLAHLNAWADPAPGYLARHAADLSGYLAAPPGLPFAGRVPTIAIPEARLFPGLVVLLMSLVALVPLGRTRTPNRWRWLYVAVAVVTITLSLGPEPKAWGRPIPFPPIYSWLLSVLPLFHAIRVPARFGMLAIMAMSVLAAMGASRLLTGASRRRAVVVTAALCGVILWEGYGGPLVVRPAGVAGRSLDEIPVREWLTRQPAGVLLDLPPSELALRRTNMSYQYSVLYHHKKTIGGAGRIRTPLQTLITGSASPVANPSLMSEAVAFLQGLRVRYVVIRPEFFKDSSIPARLAEALEQSDAARIADIGGPIEYKGRLVPYRGDVVVYEIVAAPPPAPEAGLESVPAASLRLRGSEYPKGLSLAVDGDPTTRWMSGGPQEGDEWVSIGFDRPRDIGRLDFLVSNRSLLDYPRRIEVVAIEVGKGGKERVLYSGPILAQLAEGIVRSPKLPIASIALPQNRSTRLFVRQVGKARRGNWSIDEMTLWERPSGTR